MLRIILIRHAQTRWNKERIIQGGNSDIELNDTGAEQCRCLAERLKDEDIRAIYASPMSRTVDTAEAIAAPHHLDIKTDNALREIDCGTLGGTSARDFGRHLQQLIHEKDDEGTLIFKKEGGESFQEVQERTWAFMERLMKEHDDGVVVVVTHYFVIGAILCSVLGLPVRQIGRFRIGETSVNIINVDEWGPYIWQFNDRCHLNHLQEKNAARK